LFLKIKSVLKGRRFRDIEDIKENVTTPQATPQEFENIPNSWAKCIFAQGEYFEGEPSQ